MAYSLGDELLCNQVPYRAEIYIQSKEYITRFLIGSQCSSCSITVSLLRGFLLSISLTAVFCFICSIPSCPAVMPCSKELQQSKFPVTMAFTTRWTTWTESLSRIMFTIRNLYVHILPICDNWYAIVKLRSRTTPRFVTQRCSNDISPHTNTWMVYQILVSLWNKCNKLCFFFNLHNHLIFLKPQL